MSTETTSRPLAVLLRGPGRAFAALSRAAARQVVQVRLSAEGALPALPAAPLVLVAGEPTADHLRRLTALRRRYRERQWVVVPADASAGRQWTRRSADLPQVEAPLGRGVLALLSGQAAERIRLRRGAARDAGRIERLEERLVLLSDTIQAAGSLLDPSMVSSYIMERAAERVGSERWRLYRVDEGGSLLRLDAWRDDPSRPAPAAECSFDQGLASRAARSRRVLEFRPPGPCPAGEWAREWPGELPHRVLAAPLSSRGRVIGVAEFADPAEGRFLPYSVELVQTLMEPAAIALDNAQLFRKLEERTVTDDLTGLYNARFMENYLRRETKRAARYGHPVAMLFLDLDGFKQVNDIHGHMAGSRTLVEVGQVLRENVREIDVVARWGGDEFTVVLPETDAAGARVMADRICEKIRQKVFLREMDLEVRLSASIGVGSWPENGPTAATLLAAADAAMYHVKNSGKDGVHVAGESGKTVLVPT
ncbi:MAG: sensor domain-containing diguanylate cyclase [Acidobacteriota bacterium]|nr:sensor domain-containing diguanylate cyclase [Acidobacteriota bacterium]MDQ7088102.1 sensor domain-containing diguanylate cyclase [Acidobacteriota bacterium]